MIEYINTIGFVTLTVCFIALIFVTGWAFERAFTFPHKASELGATICSVILSLVVFGTAILLVKGFRPFFQGLRLPVKAFLLLWPLCALFAIQIKFEISGNTIIDSLIMGLCVLLIATIATAGCMSISEDAIDDSKLISVWLIGSLFLAIIIRAILWALR